MPYVQSSSWNAHSENFLQTLLYSSNSDDRKFAIKTICKHRGAAIFGNTSIRIRRNLTLNTDATTLVNLIDWSSDVHEPL